MTDPTQNPPPDLPPTLEVDSNPAGAMLSDDQIRWLRRAVGAMSALLIAGVFVLIGRVIYLARPSGTQATSAFAGPALLPEVKLLLPPGAVVKSIAAISSQIVVLHTVPAGDDRIVVLDLATGRVTSRVTIQHAP